MNYKNVVDTLRASARDCIRLASTAKVASEIYDLTVRGKELADVLASYNKEDARLKYQLKKVDAENPDAKEITDGLNKAVESVAKDIESVNKEIEANTKAIADLNTKVADIQSGKVLVSRQHLDNKTNELVEAFGLQAALDAVSTPENAPEKGTEGN